MAVTTKDPRPIRAVVRYEDWPDEAFDVLECGHTVPCRREAGGREVRSHDEPCGRCLTLNPDVLA